MPRLESGGRFGVTMYLSMAGTLAFFGNLFFIFLVELFEPHYGRSRVFAAACIAACLLGETLMMIYGALLVWQARKERGCAVGAIVFVIAGTIGSLHGCVVIVACWKLTVEAVLS